jgi:2-methylcitrate dehydratase PrpD
MSTGPDWSEVGATLGQNFHVTRLTFKNHVGCGHNFPAIDGALELRAADTASRIRTLIASAWACTRRRWTSPRTRIRRAPTRAVSA